MLRTVCENISGKIRYFALQKMAGKSEKEIFRFVSSVNRMRMESGVSPLHMPVLY
jgi:hypothetical protein